MRRVVFNQKGGVGKTSITCNLAAIGAAMGYRTLVVDLDVQGNTTHYLVGEIGEVINDSCYMKVSLVKEAFDQQRFPTSRMGAAELIRTSFAAARAWSPSLFVIITCSWVIQLLLASGSRRSHGDAEIRRESALPL